VTDRTEVARTGATESIAVPCTREVIAPLNARAAIAAVGQTIRHASVCTSHIIAFLQVPVNAIG